MTGQFMEEKMFQPVLPRAIKRVHATADAATILAQLSAGFEDFKAKNNGRVDDLQAALDDHSKVIAAYKLNGNINTRQPADPVYAGQFGGYFRKGEGEDALRTANSQGERGLIKAAMSVGSNPDGGYLAPVEWDRQIHQAQVILSPMRQISSVITTTVAGFSTLWNNNQWGTGWVGETATRPQTTSAQLSPIFFSAGEIYAEPAATQKLLDDSAIDVGAWFGAQLGVEFSRQEGIAFVSGDGSNKPAGYLGYVTGGPNDTALYATSGGAHGHPGGNLDVIASGAVGAIASDSLVDFFYGLASPYRQNATWVMSSTTAAVVGKLKNGQGDYLWRDAFLADQPPTLLGRPVVIDENLPAVATGNLAIAFGDFRAGYLINDRTGVRVLRDPYTSKPYVLFYTTKRVGGGVLDPRAIRLLKIG